MVEGIARMPIALEMGEGIGGSRYARAAVSCSRSSSIGRNSDCSSAGGAGGEAEVQSSYKGPLETMDALEDSLPIRRGISKFYCGKSKSFAILSDAMTKLSSAKELGKPESSYSRKRKKLLAMTNRWETGDCDRSSGFIDSASKRHAHSSDTIAGSPVAPAFSFTSTLIDGEGRDQFQLLPPPCLLEPESLFFPVRSFSLMDLEGMERLSSSSSSFSSIASDEPKGFS